MNKKQPTIEQLHDPEMILKCIQGVNEDQRKLMRKYEQKKEADNQRTSKRETNTGCIM